MQAFIEKMVQDQIKAQLNQQLSKSLGMNDSQAQDMIENSLPYLLGGLQKNASSKEGAESLLEALTKDDRHDGHILDNLESLTKDPEAGEGGRILGHIFGDKEDAVEQDIANRSGVDKDQAKKGMMVMAPMLMAMLGKLVRSEKMNADKLSEVVTDVSKNKDVGGAGMKLVYQFLDQDKDGDLKDDFIRMGKNWLGKKLGGR